MKMDIELQRDVVAELARDAYVRDENIGTAVHDGVVTLMGTVDNYAHSGASPRSSRRAWAACAPWCRRRAFTC